ncbi:kinase-like protein [Fistulina hepatica ATCC 64428]|uniref:Kinase-like protein n=1 Tax=Fistulina hepatica ATCC 64428 TaxID=1128425 RepID=A0A0D7ASV1_9AGAR|nr:kinase-like protein [Fistulina hepatica ATCC 64428]
MFTKPLQFILSLLDRIRLWLYYRLTCQPAYIPRIRYFRFGIPLVMKRSRFPESSESAALRVMNKTFPDLPIPRLIDSLNVDGEVYTIMTRIPGDTLMNVLRSPTRTLTDEQIRDIVYEVYGVIRRLWTLRQPPELGRQVMLSAGGHGLPDARSDYAELLDPCSIAECYVENTAFIKDSAIWGVEQLVRKEPERMAAVMSDDIVWVHCDLRALNIMVHNGKFSGIIDWESSGWHARHWQLLVVRVMLFVTNPPWVTRWWDEIEFEPEVEAAYKAGRELIRNWV